MARMESDGAIWRLCLWRRNACRTNHTRALLLKEMVKHWLLREELEYDVHESSTKSHVVLRPCFEFNEFAAGAGNLSKALLRRGLHGGSWDILFDESHDCLKPEGFKLWLLALSSMAHDGLIWFGTKCSSWVVLCMSQSDQRVENSWWGDQDRDFVIEGNALTTVTSLLFFLDFYLVTLSVKQIT